MKGFGIFLILLGVWILSALVYESFRDPDCPSLQERIDARMEIVDRQTNG